MIATVGAHRTNGKASKEISNPKDRASTCIVHANKRWPQAITTSLWPCTIQYANDSTVSIQDPRRRSPRQISSGSDVDINKRSCKPFDCPVYVLHSELQVNKPLDKWRSRARIGNYHGQYPNHNKKVALVLNQDSGYVSLLLCIKHDVGFRTFRQEIVPVSWLEETFSRNQVQ